MFPPCIFVISPKSVSYTHLVDWYIKAEDIILKKGAAMNPQPPKKDAPPVK